MTVHRQNLIAYDNYIFGGMRQYEEEPQFNCFEYEALNRDFGYKIPLAFSFKHTQGQSKFFFQPYIARRSGKVTLYDTYHLGIQISPQKQVEAVCSDNAIKFNCKGWFQGDEKDGLRIFGGLACNRKIQNPAVHLGFHKVREGLDWQSSLTGYLGNFNNDVFMQNRVVMTQGNFKWAFLGIFNIWDRNLQLNNLGVQWVPHRMHQFSLRGEVDGVRNYSLKFKHFRNYFDFIVASYIAKPTNQLSVMTEVKYDVQAGKLRSVGGLISRQLSSKQLRVKINSLGDLALHLHSPLRMIQNGSVDFGIQVADLLKNRRISYGFKVSLQR